MRVANACDRAAIQRIAELEQSAAPVGPLLIGEILQRPVAAVSLADGSVIADPFAATSELVELMGVRARQLRGSRTPARGAEGWRLLGWRVSR
ncbi:MAG: hypothetical protein DLM63_07580 [Solirubrobacterales bacterium]|nr:MAG: hypothetical protein DLM63_07580 [Solirubrobacterales bacterium]